VLDTAVRLRDAGHCNERSSKQGKRQMSQGSLILVSLSAVI
jgi:hypothetical protein